MKTLLEIAGGIIAVLLAFLGIELERKNEAEAKAINVDTKIADAKLETKLEAVDDQSAKLKVQLEQPTKDLSPDQVQDFLEQQGQEMKTFVTMLVAISVALVPIATKADVTHLAPGQVAPYEGYLFDKQSELDARTAVQQNDLYKKLNDSQGQAIDLLNQRVDLYMKQNDTLAKQVGQDSDSIFWHSFIFFITGAATTVGVVYGVSRITK